MSGPVYSGSTSPSAVNSSDLLAHIRLLQDALDASTQTEAALVRAESQIAALQDQVDRLSAQIVDSQRHAEALQRELGDLRNSQSWRLTAPLRLLRGWLPHKP